MKQKGYKLLAAAAMAASCSMADVDWPSTFAVDVATATATHAASAASGTGALEVSFDSLIGGWSALELALSAADPFDSRSRTWWASAGIVFNASKPRGMVFNFR